MQLSVTVRNALLDAYETAIGTSPQMIVYTGSKPADCATAATGTILATLSLPSDWAAAASSGQKTKLGTWTGSVVADGTAGYYRIYNTAGTVCHEQGTLGTTGADINLTSTTLVTGDVLVIDTKTLVAPNA